MGEGELIVCVNQKSKVVSEKTCIFISLFTHNFLYLRHNCNIDLTK